MALAVAAATAVLTGALLVGDSMRGSLRDLTLQRLGRIDQVLVLDRFFQQDLAKQLTSDDRFETNFDTAIPIILFPRGTAEHTSGPKRLRARGITVVGCDTMFWDLDTSGLRPSTLPSKGASEVVLNEPLAAELGAAVGDLITLRLPTGRPIPADSPLGHREGLLQSLPRLEVVAIVPADGLGRFDLSPRQSVPRCAYLDREFLQHSLDQPHKVNALLVATEEGAKPSNEAASSLLVDALHPSLEDYGLRLSSVSQSWIDPTTETEETAYAYYQLTTDRMMLTPEMERAAMRALADLGGTPIFTYLANDLQITNQQTEATEHGIPYSTIAAVDWQAETLGPLLTTEGAPLPLLRDDQIVLNRWAQKNLGADVGDQVRVTYFDPETTHGEPTESTAEFTLAAVVELIEPKHPYSRRQPAQYDQPPPLANDPDLTPVVEGLTDQASINDWDAPFPIDYDRIRSVDDDYWASYRTTPKAFVSLSAGRKMWGSRFGATTSIRLPLSENIDLASIQEQLLKALSEEKEELGFRFLPVKQNGLTASAGTTPFALLFLLFSLFVIAAAVMLIALLYRLGIEQRAEQLGLLLALGLPRRLVTRLFVCEGMLTALSGALLGAGGGVGYAALLLAGLRTWWLDAVITPFLTLHLSPWSLVAGPCMGIVVSITTMILSVRRLSQQSTHQLLSGSVEPNDRKYVALPSNGISTFFSAVLLLAALGLGILATQLGGEAQAGAFMGCGAMILSTWLLGTSNFLRQTGRPGRPPVHSLLGLALHSAARSPLRSTLTIGLVASSSFLMVATGVFRLDPQLSGAGGFALLAESDQPLFSDLNTFKGKEALLGTSTAKELEEVAVLALRQRDGDDASCRNLYQSSQPRLIGITPSFVEHYDTATDLSFDWAATIVSKKEANPWRALMRQENDEANAIPVVLDKNTALYSLHLYGGVGERFTLDYDEKEISFVVVGLLANSLFQGSLLIDEQALLENFPETSGYRYFLIDPGPRSKGQVTETFETAFRDEGFDVVSTKEILEELLAVQNTYLSAFQSLGALGLLLGTFGLATVQLRNVVLRRGELALLRAAGFRRRRVALLVFYEHLTLLVGGLIIGSVSALAAVAPHLFVGGASLPTGDMVATLALILATGSAAGLIGVFAVLRADLLASLRGG